MLCPQVLCDCQGKRVVFERESTSTTAKNCPNVVDTVPTKTELLPRVGVYKNMVEIQLVVESALVSAQPCALGYLPHSVDCEFGVLAHHIQPPPVQTKTRFGQLYS